MRHITSRHNALVSRYRDVARGKVPHFMLLEGAHLVEDALAAAINISHITVRSDILDDRALHTLLDRLSGAGVEVASATRSVVEAISPVRTPSGIVGLAIRPQAEARSLYESQAAFVIVASGIQDPGNLGAIVRVSEAGGASGVVADVGCADPFGWKALRGAMGSTLRLPILAAVHAADAVADARRAGCRILATAPRGGRDVFSVDLRRSVAVLIGGEGRGLVPELLEAADERIMIPMQPPVDSLNAATTAAVIVYEARRQRALRQVL